MTSSSRPRTILHADMDAFYASVEQRDDPALRGQPVIVGGLGRRGVVSAASYEARVFGVRSAMPVAQARERCPQGIYRRGRMAVYAGVSRQIREVFDRFTPLVEPLSLDEAFLDCTGSEALFGDGAAIATQIRAAVWEAVQLTISVGVASSKFVAKVASDSNKPDGMTVVEPGTEEAFLGPLPVARLWGIGPQQQHRLSQLGFAKIADLQALTLSGMIELLGSHQGEHFFRLCRGLDDRVVEPNREVQSISHETTFDRDLTTRDQCLRVLLDQSAQVGRRLRRNGLRGRVVRLKLRDPDFTTRSRQRKLPGPVDDDAVIYRAAVELFDGLRPAMEPVRLLGVGVAELGDATAPVQQGLFGDLAAAGGGAATGPEVGAPPRDRAALLDAMDRIRDRFGEDAIGHGWSAEDADED